PNAAIAATDTAARLKCNDCFTILLKTSRRSAKHPEVNCGATLLVLIYNLAAQSLGLIEHSKPRNSGKLHSNSKIRASPGVVNTFLPGSRDGTGFPVYCAAQTQKNLCA